MTAQPNKSVATEPEPPKVSFVIPVRNDAAGLARCLASVAASAYPHDRLEILVADNGSADESAAVARAAGAAVIDVPDLSVAAVRNAAVRASSGTVIAFVDADHEIGPAWLDAAAEALRDPTVGAVGAPYHAPPNSTWVQRSYDLLRDHTPGRREVAWLGSGNLVVRRTCFDEASGFDESLTTCEDVDLCSRLRSRGYRVQSDSLLASVHHGDPRTLGELFGSETWRGQDNLRVSWRHRSSIRDGAGAMMPIVVLVSLGLLVGGLGPMLLGDGLWMSLGALGLSGTIALRVMKMIANGGAASLARLPALILVGGTYELARALALVLRAPHRRARSTPAVA